MPRARFRSVVTTIAFLGLVSFGERALATTIVINNLDGVDEGFNDPTPAAPVGGNAGTTIGAQRLNAFNHAAGIWETVLDSAVPIRVDARFNPQFCAGSAATLGSAGPATLFANFTNAPLAATFYAAAVADRLAGVDQEVGQPDIIATFNSNIGTGGGCPFDFYYGLDGNAGADIDLVSVVIHELAHGLGFLTILSEDGSEPYSLGFDDAYSHWLEDHSLGLTMPSMTQAERQSAQTNSGQLHFTGPTVRAASNLLSSGAVGDHVRMYAPAAFNQGSSVSHWDTVLVPDQSQEPSYTVPIHDLGLSLPLLCDVGWGPCLCGNGVVDPGEGCDDDATVSGDGCGATCQVEECWSCAGAPSVCTPLGSGTGCTDQNACTQTDQCDGAGTCVGSNPVICTPLDDCHDAGTCTPATGQCSNPPAADGTACDDGDSCTDPDQCLSGTCAGLPDCVDPFLCYKAKSAKVGGAFQAPPAQTLVDEFNEVVDFNIVKPRYLCTPAEKNGEAQADIATHLEGYAIKPVKGEPPHLPRQFLTVRNQLNAPLNVIVVDTVKPELLLVPTAKNLAFDPPAPGGGIEVDHYECYKIKVSKGTPKFPKGVSITLADQFIASAQAFGVVKPTHLCTPVDKEGEGVKHAGIYQLCYSIKRSVKNPQHLGLFTHNQFGAERIDTIQESRVCVPSIVE